MLSGNNSQNKTRNIILILAALFTLLLSGCGGQTPKVYQVGILHEGGNFAVIADGFKAKMTELGYVEGKNIVYNEQIANSDPAEEQRLAKKLVDDKVDLIFTFPSPPTFAVKAATRGTDIPIVFANATLEGSDLVESVRSPGGNITGVRYPGPETITKRLELMLQVAPQVKRVWIGYDKNSPNNTPVLEALRPTAATLGVTLVEVPAASVEELKADLAARAAAADLGLDAIILMPDGFNNTPAGFGIISKFAADHKVPLGAGTSKAAKQSAVFGNANDLVKTGQLAAPLADKVLKGTKAGTIPVVTPEQELWINYKVAQQLGLTVPEGLLRQAAEIIR